MERTAESRENWSQSVMSENGYLDQVTLEKKYLDQVM